MFRSLASSRFIVICVSAMGWPAALRQANGQTTASFHIIQAGPATFGEAVSADGSTVVGGVSFGGGEGQAFRWTQAGGVQLLGDLSGGAVASFGRSVSADGSVVVGSGTVDDISFQAARWSNGWAALGLLGCDPGSVTPFSWAGDVSADGSVIVGESHPCGAFRSAGGSIVEIGGDAESALGVSADGSVIVGYRQPDMQPAEAFRWTAGGGVSGLGWLAGGPPTPESIAYNVSANGATVVGRSTGPGGQLAFRWTQATGMVSLGDLPGGIVFSEALGLSADASRIVGRSHVATAGQLSNRAFIWEQDTGIRDLNDVLVNEYGVSLGGWTLIAANDISDDGRVIVGNAHNGAQHAGWVVILSDDTDGDGLLDDWEVNGIPYTDSTGIEQRYVLDLDGDGTPDCDVDRKDIFVEVDAMTGLAPSPATFTAVVAAFNAAPVSNPNGAASGIKLHVILDDVNIPAAAWTLDDTDGNGSLDWPTEFDSLKLAAASGTTLAGYFGTTVERNDPEAEGIRGAKAKAYRYCIFAQRFDAEGTSGLAELPGNDFIVTLGLWPPGGGTPDQQAGTFMHELGHSLGLGHGGRAPDGTRDDTNFKPNYYSVMSYNWQTPKPWMTPGSWPLSGSHAGYSAFAIPAVLNEAAADDCLPALVVPGSSLSGVRYPHNTHNDGAAAPVIVYGRFDVASDWNNDDLQQCGAEAVPVDLTRVRPTHGRSPNEMLHGRDD